MLNIEAAREELKTKDMQTIQKETAWKWASRAAAAFEKSTNSSGIEKVITMLDAKEFIGEAKEHASQVSPEFLREIEEAVVLYVVDAIISLDQAMKGDQNV